MPISTMLKRRSCRSSSRASTRTCPAISPAVRCRANPIFPVRQNRQPIAQPTWVDTQKVIAGVSGMNTDSMPRPSARVNRNFRVPSSESSRPAMRGVEKDRVRPRVSRSDRERSVMPSNASSPRRYTQR